MTETEDGQLSVILVSQLAIFVAGVSVGIILTGLILEAMQRVSQPAWDDTTLAYKRGFEDGTVRSAGDAPEANALTLADAGG